MTTYPVSSINGLLKACNAGEPLMPGDPRRYDFTALRHARVLERLKKIFRDAPGSGKFHHRVLCGHRGSGKSTELLAFKDWADNTGFACERIEVDVQLGQIQLEFSDFYLLAAKAAEKLAKQGGVPLAERSMRPIIEWFAEVTKEDKKLRRTELAVEAEAQLGGTAPFSLGKLLAKFSSGVKAGSSHATTVRQQLRNYPDRLIDSTNSLLTDANENLRDAKPPATNGIVLLFDNLDRYPPDLVDQVLMRGSNLLRRLGCHVLYTIPIDLEYNPRSGPLRDAYGPPIVLPMIPLRRPGVRWGETVADSSYEPAALAGMKQALAMRIVIEKIFEDASDAERLIRHCGGCVRDLMHLMTLSYEMSDGDTLTREGTRLAIQELRATYARELAAEDYQRLAAIATGEQPPRDDLTLKLLYNRWALEYYGEERQVWLDVHPATIEIEELRRACRDRRKTDI